MIAVVQCTFWLQALRRTSSVILKEVRQTACATAEAHSNLHVHELALPWILFFVRKMFITYTHSYIDRHRLKDLKQNHHICKSCVWPFKDDICKTIANCSKTCPTSVHALPFPLHAKTSPTSRTLSPFAVNRVFGWFIKKKKPWSHERKPRNKWAFYKYRDMALVQIVAIFRDFSPSIEPSNALWYITPPP